MMRSKDFWCGCFVGALSIFGLLLTACCVLEIAGVF